MVLSAAGVGVPLWKHRVPTVLGGVGHQLLHRGGVFDVEGQVVQPRAATVVLFGREGRRLLDDQVGRPEPPAASAVPALEEDVTKRLQQPAERGRLRDGCPAPTTRRDAACRVTAGSCGGHLGAGNEPTVFEASSGRDERDETECVHGPPAGLGGLDELEGHGEGGGAGAGAGSDLVPSRTVENMSSMGFVVRRWIHCSARKSKKASGRWSSLILLTALGNFAP